MANQIFDASNLTLAELANRTQRYSYPFIFGIAYTSPIAPDANNTVGIATRGLLYAFSYSGKTYKCTGENPSGWSEAFAQKDDLGVTKTATASGTKTVADGSAITDISISAGTWLVWGYAGAQKVRLQDNASNHMIYKAGINPQSVITATAPTNLQLVNISGSDLSVWADATNYYLMVMRLK